jgi:hypothetical protein
LTTHNCRCLGGPRFNFTAQPISMDIEEDFAPEPPLRLELFRKLRL